MSGEYVPEYEFETLPDGTIRVTDNSIEDAVRDVFKRLTDAKETALKEAIKSLGWIAPEDLATHDARIASEAAEAELRRYAKERYLDYLTEPDLPWMEQKSPMAQDYARNAANMIAEADRLASEREAGDE